MSLLLAAFVIVAITLVAGALALAAFFLAIHKNQLSVEQMSEGGSVIFDSVERVGIPTDLTLKPSLPDNDDRSTGH